MEDRQCGRQDFRRRFQIVEHDELVRLYPPPPEYREGPVQMEPDAIEAMPSLASATSEGVGGRAATVPFYKRSV